MSSRRLLLCSGAPGSGSTSVARALVRAAKADGQRAALVSAADGDGASEASPLAAVLASWDPVIVETLVGAPLLRTAAGLLAAARALADPQVDLVVWDAGAFDTLGADLAALDALPVLAGRVTAPMLTLAAGIPSQRIAALRDLLDRLAEALDDLRGPLTGLVLVEEPTADLTERVRRARAHAELLALDLPLVVVNRVPRKGDGWPAAWARERRRAVRAARASTPEVGPQLCAIPWFTSGGVIRRMAARLPSLASLPDSVSPAATTQPIDDGYAWHLPMAAADPARVRAGRLADALVIDVEGLRRLTPLPPVLARCTVAGGGIVGDDLVIRFRPDPAQWRSAS